MPLVRNRPCLPLVNLVVSVFKCLSLVCSLVGYLVGYPKSVSQSCSQFPDCVQLLVPVSFSVTLLPWSIHLLAIILVFVLFVMSIVLGLPVFFFLRSWSLYFLVLHLCPVSLIKLFC